MVRRATFRAKPGRALDAGCGDGKNTAFLLEQGWSVDAFDTSLLALEAFDRRIAGKDHQDRVRRWRDECASAELKAEGYDLVLSYGLYHCLDSVSLLSAHERLIAAVKPGGRFVFAAFNNDLPVPPGHGTEALVLRDPDHILGLMKEWKIESFETGIITEDHRPMVGEHCHSLTWAIFKKGDK